MIDFREFYHKSKDVINSCLNRFTKAGYSSLSRIPSYQAPDIYKRCLLPEDLYYRYIPTNDMLLFKETGNLELYLNRNLQQKCQFFHDFLISAKVHKDDCKRYIGIDILDKLSDLTDISISSEYVTLPFRFVPTTHGTIMVDSFSQTNTNNVHLGLDSILFWNFLNGQKKAICTANNAIDVGCGTGIHTLLLKKMNPQLDVTCTDVNPRCVHCAEVNMDMNNVNRSINYVQGNWFDGVKKSKYDIIISNPPFEWREESEEDYQITSSYGGRRNYGMECTMEVIDRMLPFINLDGKGYVMSQTIVNDNGDLLIKKEIEKFIKESGQPISVKINILFDHLLASQAQMQNMFNKSFSHFCLVVIELTMTGKHAKIDISDSRPYLKRVSDALRVQACRRYWRGCLNA